MKGTFSMHSTYNDHCPYTNRKQTIITEYDEIMTDFSDISYKKKGYICELLKECPYSFENPNKGCLVFQNAPIEPN